MRYSCIKTLYKSYLATRKAASTVIGCAKLRILGRARLGSHVTVAGPIRVKVFPGGKLIIGDDVRFQSGFRYNPVGHECVTGIWVGKGGRLEIESGAGLSAVTIVCLDHVTIGRNTLIGGGTRIYDTDFHALTAEQRRRCNYLDVKKAPVNIGANCFVGGYCTILKGVTIGDGSVIGACSVVTKKVPAGQIWAGNPACYIRDVVQGESPTSSGGDCA